MPDVPAAAGNFHHYRVAGGEAELVLVTVKFFTPALAVGLNYTTTDGADSFGINGTFRF